MVIQRTVEKLRERPEHERAAVAGSIAIGVVVILFVSWIALFLHGVGSGETAVSSNPQVASSSTSASTSAPAPALEWQASTSSLDDGSNESGYGSSTSQYTQ